MSEIDEQTDYRVVWNEAIEAATELLESQEGHGAHNRFAYAAAIRKLRKE